MEDANQNAAVPSGNDARKASPTLNADPPARKWYWRDSRSPLLFKMPEEVETWHPSVAYPVRQSEGLSTMILWPYGALYSTHKDALLAAIAAQEKHVEDALGKLRRLRAALNLVDKPSTQAANTPTGGTTST